MKTLFVVFIISAFVSLLISPLGANEVGGGDAWSFLSAGMGARAIGLGGSFVALADDATATYWNPSGLAQLNNREMTLMHIVSSKYEFDSGKDNFGSYNHMGIALPIKLDEQLRSGFGISFIHFTVDDIPHTEVDPFGEIVLLETFANTEWALTSSFGIACKDWFLGGLGGRYMRQSFLSYSVSGYGIDCGFLLKLDDLLNLKRDLNLGYMLQVNFNRQWKENENEIGSDDRTIKHNLGLAFNLINKDERKLVLALSVSPTHAAPTEISLGTEFQTELRYSLVGELRCGVNGWRIWEGESRLGNILNDSRRITAGAGIMYEYLKVDYAMTTNNQLEEINHWISVTLYP